MDTWRDIRLLARRRHDEVSVSAGLSPAATLVAAGLRAAGLQIDRFAPGTVYGPGVLGALEREGGFVRLASDLKEPVAAVVAAHEIGHFWLHDESAFMIRSTEPGFGGGPVETGVERVVAYSPRQRHELQADVFAQEFLLPADRLRERLVAGERPSVLAASLGLPVEFVRMQAIRALLLPPLQAPDAAEPVGAGPPPDPEQRAAAEWDDRPVIVDAGPGTGKTSTLVARVKHLLDRGVAPSTILVMTYSNKAAAELAERIARLDPAAAALVWVGTFHAFGLELLRLHHEPAGLPPDFEVMDDATGLALLEELLPQLELRHYQNLWDPTLDLRAILRAISRAKDEMVSVSDYAAAARVTRDAARTPEEIERGERALEVARVYAMYEEALHDRKLVDFGDLVLRPTLLLAGRSDVREAVRSTYREILVDEYQDVNAASVALLDSLAEGGRHVWVVADPRQSIYRFRGAAPSNAGTFTARYPGAERVPLKTNYRSCETVVRVFERFAHGMAAAPQPPARWEARRGRVGFVETIRATDLQSEAVAIRDQIERLREQGIPYDRQAILARTHLCLARFGRILQDLDVPVLYLGNLFERPEIRDLLALVSLGADAAGAGLVRVADFPEYGVPRADALKVVAAAAERKESVLVTCADAGSVEGVTPAGVSGLGLLARHLAGAEWATTAWQMLSRYLLETSAYLRPFLDGTDVRTRQSLVAVYQLLKFAREQSDANDGRGGRRHLLEEIRRLERLDDDRQFRLIPPEADGLPAVRMMTVHASKGLEFEAVHLPQVATYYVPVSRRPIPCPAPVGLERLDLHPTDHAAEEECLFFVALSRARDALTVSSATRYTPKRTSNPSKFLASLAGAFSTARSAPVVTLPVRGVEAVAVPARDAHEERHLEVYSRCPARYRFEVVDGLAALANRSAFLRFHGCVRRTLAWMSNEVQAGREVSAADAVAHLDSIWPERGPVGGFAEVYLAEARRMVANAAAALKADGVPVERVLQVDVAGRTVTVRPDRVVEASDGAVVIRRYRTGRKSKGEAAKPIWSLLASAGEATFPGREIRLEAFYPATAETDRIAAKRGVGALDDYVEALDGIERGHFPPRTSRDCPTCQFYFICTAEDSF